MLDELVVALADVGLILHENKTKLLTTQAQPPNKITTPRGLNAAVVDRAGCHKWLGCILSGNNRGSHIFDLEYHLQAASKAILANRNIVCDVARVAAGHRKIYKAHLETMDVHFRRLLRSVAGDPSQTNYVNPWHEFFFMTGMPGLEDMYTRRAFDAPFRMWHSAAETFCRWKGIGDW